MDFQFLNLWSIWTGDLYLKRLVVCNSRHLAHRRLPTNHQAQDDGKTYLGLWLF